MSRKLARIIIALPALIFGIMHLLKGEEMVQWVPDFLPMKLILVYVSGAMLVFFSVLLILHKMSRIAALVLSVMVLIIAILVYMPGVLAGNETHLTLFIKDVAIAAAYYYIYLFSED
jgi:uncharacterized membrane protein